MALRELYEYYQQKKTVLNIKEFIVIAGLALTLTFLEVFDTSSVSVLDRMIYWVVLLIVGHLCRKFIVEFSFKRAIDLNLNILTWVIFFSLIFSIPMFLFVFFIDIVMAFGGQIMDGQFSQEKLAGYLLNEGQNLYLFIFIWFGQVFLIVAIVSACLMILLYYQCHNSKSENSKLSVGDEFFKKIPNNLGQEILCLTMEDHYVRVHLTKGEHLLLMRMRDAVNELRGYKGFQTHRSWWVSSAAIKSTGREGRQHFLLLKKNIKVPVSNSYLKKIKEKGYF